MKRHQCIAFGFVILFTCNRNNTPYPDVQPPVAEKKPVELAMHGYTRIDNYYWLNQREDPAVIDYLTVENKYLDTMLAHTREFQEDLFNEMKDRIKERDSSVPYKDGSYYFYTRYEEGHEYPIYCRKEGSLSAPEEIVIDGNQLGKEKDFFNFFVKYSPDKNLACVVMDTVGRRFYTIKFKDLTTGEFLQDVIPATTGNLEWANDNRTLFYSR